MNYRLVNIFPDQALGTSGTKVVNINLRDPISRLIFNYSVTSGSNARKNHISSCFTKIELIDGSQSLISLDGTQMDGLPFFLGGNQSFCNHSWQQDAWNGGRMYYDFGRWLFDQKYAFDPTKLTNPQLRITYDATQPCTGGSDVNLRVDALVFDELTVKASHFLAAKVIKEYSPTNDGWEYTELPTDYPYRFLGVQALKHGESPFLIVDTARLTEDNDKRIPYDIGFAELIYYNQLLYGHVTDSLYGTINAEQRTAHVRPCVAIQAGAITSDYANTDNISRADGGHITVIASAASTKVTVNCWGLCPNGIAAFPIGDPKDEADWYNVRNIGSLQLQLKAGSSAESKAGNPAIIVQQARGY